MNAAADILARITSDPHILQGQPCIRNLRIPAAMILESLAEGMAEDQILAELPVLDRDHVHAALAFAGRRMREEIALLPARA
jgi:uncharacterized protein (DUF433 family)